MGWGSLYLISTASDFCYIEKQLREEMPNTAEMQLCNEIPALSFSNSNECWRARNDGLFVGKK